MATERYYTARVHDNNDPDKRGRLTLEIAGLLDLQDEDPIWPDWIEPRYPGGIGAGSVGLHWIPPIDSIVVVEMEVGAGATLELRWMGSTSGNKGTLPSFLASNYPNRAGLSSPDGSTVIAMDNQSGLFVLVGSEDPAVSTKSYITIDKKGGVQIGTQDGTVVLMDKNKISLLTSAASGKNHLFMMDEETEQIALVHMDGTEFLTIDPGVFKLNATAMQLGVGTLEIGDGVAPPINPLLLTTANFADWIAWITAVDTFMLAVSAAAVEPLLAPAALAFIGGQPTGVFAGKHTTSLAAGAPYLSALTKIS